MFPSLSITRTVASAHIFISLLLFHVVSQQVKMAKSLYDAHSTRNLRDEIISASKKPNHDGLVSIFTSFASSFLNAHFLSNIQMCYTSSDVLLRHTSCASLLDRLGGCGARVQFAGEPASHSRAGRRFALSDCVLYQQIGSREDGPVLCGVPC